MTNFTKRLSQEQLAWSRNMQSQIRNASKQFTNEQIGDAIGIDKSGVCRFLTDKEKQIERLCEIMAVVGLKVVPSEMKCYDPATADFFFNLGKEFINRAEGLDDLMHNDASIQLSEGTYKPREF